MDRNTQEVPMDFEWENQAPADPTSPFFQISQHGQRSEEELQTFPHVSKTLMRSVGGFESPVKPFDSPSKAPSIFSSAAPTATPFRNPSFTTPRKPFDADLFSENSGIDSSPAENADSEATPDPATSRAGNAFIGGRSEKKPSMFGKYGDHFAGNSPGRGEMRRGKYGMAIANKVRKRKRLERDYPVSHARRGSYDSEGDSGGSRPSSQGKGEKEAPQHWFSSFLDGIASRPSLPYILSHYAQFLLNAFMALVVMFLVYTFFDAIRGDVNKASEEATAAVRTEMAQCAKEYTANLCGGDRRVPAMEHMCNSWEACMNRDPHSVGRAKVSAHTFAEIFNSFVEPISWKAMVFTVIIITVCISVNNVAFSVFRSRGHPPPPPTTQYYDPPPQAQDWSQWGPVPQTPRQIAHQDMYGGYPAIMPSQTPGRSPRKASRH
ncbi:MAG: hypothetical protein M1818_003475 [Claussenomyces sp. TS43310]|nr:MAG: hypothetical protein M1818_003475 [Claussenomyces sp. TS43310]